jgi:hypothetical protein
MNTFQFSAALLPVVRYDQRFATVIGKWLCNLATNARLFYPAYLPADAQDNPAWSRENDSENCIAYEGLRANGWGAHQVEADHATPRGDIVGTHEDTIPQNTGQQRIEPDTDGKFEHIWKMRLPAAKRHMLSMELETKGTVDISFALSSEGPYTHLLTVENASRDRFRHDLTEEELTWKWNYDGDVYLRAASDTDARLVVHAIGAASIMARPDDSFFDGKQGPYGTGDALSGFGSQTNLGLYGSSHVGYLGAIVEPTNVSGVLKFDCLATDFFESPAYPTYMYYNPHDSIERIDVEINDGDRDVYDTTRHEFVERDISGTATVTIPPKSSCVVVLSPEDAKPTVEGTQLLLDRVVVDYRYPDSDPLNVR